MFEWRGMGADVGAFASWARTKQRWQTGSYVGKKRLAAGATTLGDGWAGCAVHALGQGARVGVDEMEVAVTWEEVPRSQGPQH